MFENIAALDIGTSIIKLVKIKTGFNDFQIKSISIQKIDPLAESREEELAKGLQKLLQEDSIQGFKVLTNLPMELSIIRTISFPFKDPLKIAEAIPFEAEENIPFGIDDLAIDFQSMKGDTPEEGRILLGASLKKHVHDFIELLNGSNVYPVKLGLEANALFECYRHYNSIDEETVIQIDIGYRKTIINIVKDNSLIFTRSISNSVEDIYKKVSSILKIDLDESEELIKNIALDLTALENNEQRGYYKSHDLKKTQLNRIYSGTLDVINDLIEEVILTLRSFKSNYEPSDFSRILLSGGGSTIIGLSTVLSRELETPVVALNFPEEFSDQIIRSQCPVVLGTALSYIRLKNSTVNLLKGEFTPDIKGESRKVYYLAGAFLVLTVFVLLINIFISLIFTSRSQHDYQERLQRKYKSYFHERKIPDNPVAAAKKKLLKEKKELETIQALVPENSSVLVLLDEVLKHFTPDSTFELSNLVINERVIRIDGSSSTSTYVDSFKEKLQQSKKFDSVSLNIRSSRKGIVRFRLTIKMKIDKDKNRQRRNK